MRNSSAFTVLFALCLLGGSAAAQTKTSPAPGVTLLEYSGRALAVADLCAAGVSIRATKYGERKATPATWGARAEVNATIAVNGDFFDLPPAYPEPGWSYVMGPARGGGEDWPANAQRHEGGRFFWSFGPRYVTLDSDKSKTPDDATEAIAGHNVLYKDNTKLPFPTTDPTVVSPRRRTAFAIDKSHEHMLLFVSNVEITGGQIVDQLLADAKDAGISEIDVITLEDGGGSSQMYVKGRGQIITSGRLVANHLGIVATGSGAHPHCPNRKPAGILESVTCDAIGGWATDSDTQPQAAEVHLYFGGPAGAPGAIGVPIKADKAGECAPFGPCNFAFSAPPPEQIFDGVEREVHAYAIDTEGGANGELLNSPKMLRCDPNPQTPTTAPRADAASPMASPSFDSPEGESGCTVGPTDASTSGGAACALVLAVGLTLRRRNRNR